MDYLVRTCQSLIQFLLKVLVYKMNVNMLDFTFQVKQRGAGMDFQTDKQKQSDGTSDRDTICASIMDESAIVCIFKFYDELQITISLVSFGFLAGVLHS